MKNLKMNLEAFMAKAENANVEVALENIQGGRAVLDDCHDRPTEVKGLAPSPSIWVPIK